MIRELNRFLFIFLVLVLIFYKDAREALASGATNLVQAAFPVTAPAVRVRDVNLLRVNEFINVKQFNTGITGGAGISDATYVPGVDLLFMADNNALNSSIYQVGNLGGAEFGNITFSGFTDTEELVYLRTIYDANGYPDSAVFIVVEESLNTFHMFTWDLQATSGTITKGTNTTDFAPTNMWTPSGTVGLEAALYLPYKNALLLFKQDTPFEVRLVPLDQGTTPAGVEIFDAETLWGALMPAINGCTYDINSRTCLCVGDATGASTTNQDILNFNCDTGAVIQHWDNFPIDLGLDVSVYGQSEGIEISPDGQNLWIASEGNKALHLVRNVNNWSRVLTTAVGNVGAGEDVLMTTTIPPGIMANVGDSIEFVANGTFAANANSKRVECDYGATPVVFIDSGSQAQNGGAWRITGKVIRTAATTQDIESIFSGPPTLFPTTPAFVTDNETLANGITIECHAEGVANNDIVQETFSLRFVAGGRSG